jgi:hypothetical protein
MVLSSLKYGHLCGQVVQVIDFKPLALTAVGLNARDFGFFHVSKLSSKRFYSNASPCLI